MEPWLGNPEWQSETIRSTAGEEYRGYAIMALLWNAFTLPMAWFVAWPEIQQGNNGAWFIGLFLLVGLWLAYYSLRLWQNWKRLGKTPLSMDPFPGCLGGDVGGRVAVTQRIDPRADFSTTISCVHITISRRGKHRTRHETVVWRERGNAILKATLEGSELLFRFAVPKDLPASEPASNDYHEWIVHIASIDKNLRFDRSFKLPVYALTPTLNTHSSIPYTEQEAATAIAPDSAVEITEDIRGLRFFYPRRRNRGMALGLSLFGIACLGFPAFMIYQGTNNDVGSGLFVWVGASIIGFMALVFSVVGLFLLLFGLYLLGNSLLVEISNGQLRTLRNIFGLRFTRNTAISNVTGLTRKITSQSGQGGKAKIRYSLYISTNDQRRIEVGDGIPGTPLAKHIENMIASACKLTIDTHQ